MISHALSPRSRIAGTGSYVPERLVTNAELEARLGTSDAWIREHTGLLGRRVAAEGETTSDMAAIAARRAVAAAGLTVADLDLIILATSTGDSPLPATAAHLQHKLGADLIPSFDLGASSAGFLYALTVGDQFIAAGTFKTVLVVGADMPSRVIDPECRTLNVLFGDGAGAVVLTASDGARGILSATLHADGTLAELMRIPGGGSAEPLTVEGIKNKRQFLRMDAPRVRELTMQHLTRTATRALKAARITSAELDWVVAQQGNVRLAEAISGRLGFPSARVLLEPGDHANTMAASIPITLDRAVRSGTIKDGQTVLACALGAGLVWGALIVRM
ncbi:MAG: beta-ketoacyl-ACP synthase III [Myxococcales bacterium]|nr:beta-ketoacyl-ACP synthase III [Myxococcales bacterium]